MNWVKTELEIHVESQLKSQMQGSIGEAYFADYVNARTKVIDEITAIPAVEPGLSDHGPKHIADVMKQVLNVISSDSGTHDLSAIELYVLLLSVLFHDVGNLFGRGDHHKNISEVYDFARGTTAKTRREKSIVLRAVAAHTGVSSDGDRDTLKELTNKDHLDGQVIKLQTIAAVLRFADELAEGPQRTTDFFRNTIGYDETSQIYHQYASCTHISVDRGLERVCLTYEIELGEYTDEDKRINRVKLTALLNCIRSRIGKFDQERRYTKFYCKLLSVFKRTEVRLNFWMNYKQLPTAFEFHLDDLVIPGESGNAQETIENNLGSTDSLIDTIVNNISSVEGSHVH